MPTFNSIVEYTGNGTTTRWSFAFEGGYIDPDHVCVSVAGATPTPATLDGSGIVVINPPVPSGTKFRIMRVTPVGAPYVDFTSGAPLTEANLDAVARQSVFSVAEQRDTYTDLQRRALLAPAGTEGLEIGDLTNAEGLFLQVQNGQLVPRIIENVSVGDALEQTLSARDEVLAVLESTEDAITAGEASIEAAATAAAATIATHAADVAGLVATVQDAVADAEAAATAATVASGVYATEALGRAAVTDGTVFAAVGATTANAVDLWQRVNASSSTFLRSQPSSQFVASQVSSLAVAATKGELLADGAAAGYALVTLTEPTSSTTTASTAALRWAKARDAHATTDDDVSVKVGRIISTLATFAKVPASATHIRARLYRRATTETGVPGGAYDTLVADTGALSLAAQGITYIAAYTGYGLYTLPLPLAQYVKVEAGFRYVAQFEFQNSASSYAPVACSVPYKQLGAAVAAPLAGWIDTAGTYVSTATTRPLCIGLGEMQYASFTETAQKAETAYADAAVATPSLLRPIERLFLEREPWTKWRYPGVSTTAFAGREGLANILGRAAWTPGLMMGELGVTFGAKTNPAAMADLKLNSLWNAPNNRVLTKSDTLMNTPNGVAFSKSKLLGGYLDLTLNTIPHTVEDCLIDADGANIVYGIAQQPAMTDPGLLTLNHVTIRGFVNAQAMLTNAHAVNCYFDFSAADTVAGGSSGNRKMWFDGCLFRRPGSPTHPFTSPTAHADVLQVGTPHNLRLIGSVLYYTATASGYSEGVVGETSGIATGGITTVSEHVWALGTVIGGGSYNWYIGLTGAGARVNNWMIVNNIFAGGGGLAPANKHYSRYGEFYLNDYVNGAVLKNLFFFGNRAADGYPVRLTGSRLPLAANVPARSNGQNISIVQVGTDSGSPIWQWTPDPGKCIEGFFNYDPATLGDEELEIVLTLGRNHGITIIDPLTRQLNPRYNLGSWVNTA